MAFPTGWTALAPITIQSSQVSANQTAFPVLLTEACLPADMLTTGGTFAAQADGGDIRFSTDTAGTRIACEIVQFTQNANPALAKAEIWIPVDVSASIDIVIYVWYAFPGGGQSQPAAGATYGSQAVWDANYLVVRHCPNGSTLSVAGSTSYEAGLGTNHGATAATGGITGRAYFDGSTGDGGSNSWIDTGYTPSLTAFTLSAWIEQFNTVPTRIPVSSLDLGEANGIAIVYTFGVIHFLFRNAGTTTRKAGPYINAFVTGAHICGTHAAGAADLTLYENAVSVGTLAENGATDPANGSTLVMGRNGAGATPFYANCYVDELRLSNIVRTPSWVSTEYANQSAPATFATTSGRITPPAPAQIRPRSTSNLVLRLGRVKLSSMSNGSAAVNAPGMGFTAADVGIPAMVFGAGPGGAPLITTVASISGSDDATLADAASTDVTDVSLIIFRAISALIGTIWWNGSLTVRGTARFAIASASLVPLVGMPVLLSDIVEGDIFGGSIASVKASNTYYSQTLTKYECECEGYEKLLAKRTTGDLTSDPMDPANSNPLNGLYKQMAIGDILQYIVANNFGGDGMGCITITGPTVDFGTRFEYGDAAADRLAALGSSGADKYFWYVDPWRVVVFAKQNTFVAPFNVIDADNSDFNVRLAISTTTDRQKYVNRGIADLGQYIGAAVTETYPGDSSSQQFSLVYLVGAAPTVWVDLGGGPTPQTVGILNSDTGKDWYYNLQSNLITQDPGGTPLTSGQAIGISYSPLVGLEILYQNDSAVDERAGIEGGTGYYERVVVSQTPITYSDGLALATATATNYASIPERVEYQSYRGGLLPGMYQQIQLTDIGASGTYLIDSVTLVTDGNIILYEVTAIYGALIGDWRATLADALGGSGSGTAGGSGTGGGGGGGASSTTTVTDVTLVADTTISSPGTSTNGQIWIVRAVQDATGGWTVTWGADAILGPDIGPAAPGSADPDTMSIITFIGIGGKWYAQPGIIGVGTQ